MTAAVLRSRRRDRGRRPAPRSGCIFAAGFSHGGLLHAHARALRVEQGFAQDGRSAALAQDLDLERAFSRVLGESHGDVTLRQRAIDVMAVATGGDPANDLAAVPDGFVTEHVRIVRLDGEADPPQRPAAGLFFESRVAADDVGFAQVDEPVETVLKGAIDGAELPIPGREVLLEAQAQQRAHAEMDEIKVRARRTDALVEATLVFRRDPDLVS